MVLSQLATKSVESSMSIDERIDELLARMTLEEKIGQMSQLNGDACTAKWYGGDKMDWGHAMIAAFTPEGT